MDFHLRGTVRRPAENDKQHMYSVHQCKSMCGEDNLKKQSQFIP